MARAGGLIADAFCIFEKQQSDARHQHSSRISVLFLGLSSSVLKLQSWGSNLWCDEEREPRAAPLAAELTEAADRICGLIEMMCSISHPNELLLYYRAHCHQSEKNIHSGTQNAISVQRRRFSVKHVQWGCFRTFCDSNCLIVNNLHELWLRCLKKIQNDKGPII